MVVTELPPLVVMDAVVSAADVSVSSPAPPAQAMVSRAMAAAVRSVRISVSSEVDYRSRIVAARRFSHAQRIGRLPYPDAPAVCLVDVYSLTLTTLRRSIVADRWYYDS